MDSLPKVFQGVEALVRMGGDVVLALMAVTFLMWTLILERFWHIYRVQPRESALVVATWEARRDHVSWYAQQIRRQIISEASQSVRRFIPMIKTLIRLCPLLGLLGTVTGMIEVFDVMSLVGSGNVRAMAGGVSKATIPTMTGMTAALAGVYFSARLDQLSKRRIQELEDRLSSG